MDFIESYKWSNFSAETFYGQLISDDYSLAGLMSVFVFVFIGGGVVWSRFDALLNMERQKKFVRRDGFVTCSFCEQTLADSLF